MEIMISRRDFIVTVARHALAVGGAGMILSDPFWQRFLLGDDEALAFGGSYLDELVRSAPRARYWTSPTSSGANCRSCHINPNIKDKGHRHKETIVKCLLCAQSCVIANGQRGKCRTRMNVDGDLRSLVYGRPVSIHVDPIEKKPLYHFLPGVSAFSLATAGCLLRCKFCQNWEISQASPEDHQVPFTPPARIVDAAHAGKAPVIAFTYNEPTVFMEYLADISRDAKKQGIRSVLISCGFMNEAPLAEMCTLLDAIKIDLKGFSEDFYRSVCGAELRPVLRSIKQIAKSHAHLEIVNLVVPTLNDSDKMLHELIEWISGEIGPDVPVHFTRFHPDYQLLNLPPTPVATLERARDMALSKGMHYPYVGNVPGHPGNHTYCPKCKKVVIERQGFFTTAMNIEGGRCKFCKRKIAGVWA
jgi:pyruvate formate lyase activating enzyme